MIISLKAQTLHLHQNKAIFWEEQSILMLADLHLGKAAHFRKRGLAAPLGVLQENLNKLTELLAYFQPKRVLFLGDLFHSSLNNVWQQFAAFLSNYPNISFELVEGNHDILSKDLYLNANLILYTPPLKIAPFSFSHYPLKEIIPNHYNFYGHLHPGVVLSGFGGHHMKLPCFHFGPNQAVLPAFGAFTGLAIVQPKKLDDVYVIAEDEVLSI